MAEPIKKQWKGFEHQAPNPKIEVFTRGIKGEADITFTADIRAGAFGGLSGYTFSESVEDLEGSFSFSVVNDEAGADGKTVFDLIPVRSVVKIYEGDLEKAAFVGIIRRRHIGAAMTGQGVKRTVTFSGKSVISCIAEYAVSLDVRILGVADAMAKTTDLTTKLAALDPLSIKQFMKITWEHFKGVAEKSGIATTGLANIIGEFIGSFDKFVDAQGKEQDIHYNVAMPFYNERNNLISQVWRTILPEPAYEIFARCDGGEPRIIVRLAPYGDPENGYSDWKKLFVYEISPLSLVSYELDQGDEEVYTAFSAYIVGSAMDRQFYLGVNQDGNDDKVEHLTEKQKIYGFKPLEIDFMGYDRNGNAKNQKLADLTKAVKKLNKLSSYWYSRMDEFYSGSVTICADFNRPETNPCAGHRAKFLGGEFYITRTDHSWNFGGPPLIKLSVSRGMEYGGDGGMTKALGNTGKRYGELEEK